MELRDVMEQLGHSQIALTANTYGHVFASRKRQMANMMDGVLKGHRPDQSGDVAPPVARQSSGVEGSTDQDYAQET
jgi:hypothetical protein